MDKFLQDDPEKFVSPYLRGPLRSLEEAVRQRETRQADAARGASLLQEAQFAEKFDS